MSTTDPGSWNTLAKARLELEAERETPFGVCTTCAGFKRLKKITPQGFEVVDCPECCDATPT